MVIEAVETAIVAPFRDTMPQSSEYWEACARETSRKTARTLQHIYLCDPCARRLTLEALNGRPPIYHGETISGYCGLCNAKTEVTLRVWFACGICWNVILAYQKTFVASASVLQYWAANMTPRFGAFLCEEKEEVRLEPYARAGKTKKQAAAMLDTLDFLVKGADTALFHIELKTGPGSIDGMSEFQLDINDSNDIIGAIKYTGLPAYIFHAQVIHQYAPPTRYSLATGLWFTDIWTLLAARRSKKPRRGEDKDAGYYRPSAFQPIEKFAAELESKRYLELASRIGELNLE
jgi:hypothetical protein